MKVCKIDKTTFNLEVVLKLTKKEFCKVYGKRFADVEKVYNQIQKYK